MKTLIILDKVGTIGMQYALVEGDVSKYNGLVLNRDTEVEKECVNFLTEGLKTDTIRFADNLNLFSNRSWNKTAVIVYYEPIPLKYVI